MFVCVYVYMYEVEQGTKQGGVLSPWLFLVFINDLIRELNNTKVGVIVNGVYFGLPMFADDLTMLSRMKSGLDRMLECTCEYGVGEFFCEVDTMEMEPYKQLDGFSSRNRKDST